MEAKGQIYQLIPKVMSGVGAVTKGRRNQQQGYQFRGIDDLYNAMQPTLIEHGIFVVPKVIEQQREERKTIKGGTLIYTVLTVEHCFYAPDGSNVTAVTVGEAMDSGDKSCNKAMSAAMKYALIEMFCIPTEEGNDTENQTHEVAPKNGPGDFTEEEMKSIQLQELIAAAGRGPKYIAGICAKAKVASLGELPAEIVDKCIAALTAEIAKKGSK